MTNQKHGQTLPNHGTTILSGILWEVGSGAGRRGSREGGLQGGWVPLSLSLARRRTSQQPEPSSPAKASTLPPLITVRKGDPVLSPFPKARRLTRTRSLPLLHRDSSPGTAPECPLASGP